MNAADLAGIALAACGIGSTSFALYLIASAWLLAQESLEWKRLELWPKWTGIPWIFDVVKKWAKELARAWLAKRMFERSLIDDEIRRRRESGVFYALFGAVFLALGSFVVGLWG
jgi:hypothetical protein